MINDYASYHSKVRRREKQTGEEPSPTVFRHAAHKSKLLVDKWSRGCIRPLRWIGSQNRDGLVGLVVVVSSIGGLAVDITGGG